MAYTTSRFHWVVAMVIILFSVCCDDDSRDGYYNYLASSYVDTVLIDDTTMVGEQVPVVHVYPYGCNSFERLDCSASSDTLRLDAIYRFRFEGNPCAHGSGRDTTQHVLCFPGMGNYTLEYQRNDANTVRQPVFVQ